ncbi:MAG: glycosyltransferase family 2 protein [Gammaproteobacteria bacterium]
MPSANTPNISVMLLVYNRSEFLAEAIDSLLAQSFKEFELILIDDHSTQPDCLELLEQYRKKDTRIRLIRQPENLGVAAGRNRAIAEAQAPYIATLDDDDLYESNKLQLQYDCLEQNPQLGACATLEKTIYRGGRIVRDEAAGKTNLEWLPATQSPNHLGRYLANHTALVRRSALLETGGYRLWFTYCAEDWDLSKRLEERYPTALLPYSLYRWRRSGTTLSTRPLCHLYGVAARLSACMRRLGLRDPIPDIKHLNDRELHADIWSVLAQLSQIPAHYMSKAPKVIARWVQEAIEAELQQSHAIQAQAYRNQHNQLMQSLPAEWDKVWL